MSEKIREQLRQLDKEQLIDIILDLREQIVELQAIVQRQSERIQALEDQVAKNSGNSSKPPSSDGLKKKPRSLREKGQRQAGGQKGHKGKTLEMVLQPDHIIHHALLKCPHCQTDVSHVSVKHVEKRQLFDIPEVQIEVTEHQGEVKICPCCEQNIKASFPGDVGRAVQYGKRIQAQATYLTMYQLLPLKRTCELFEDFYGHAPSEAVLLGAIEEVREQIAPTLGVICQQLVEVDVLQNDETGMRVAGQLQWLHVSASETLTYYAVHPKRGQEAMRAIGILPQFRGVSIHDGWASYFYFDACHHALCNAHHLRELAFVEEQYQQAWASEMAQLLRDAKQEVAHCSPEQNTLAPDRIFDYHQRYEQLLQQGFQANPAPERSPPKKRGRKKQSPPKNLLDRLQKYQHATLAFISDFRIPFDNNLAERDVRMMKVKQKISGTFRTQRGAEIFCDIRSYISTVRKQGLSVIQALHQALLGQPFIPA
jgi:transposase